jgi:hypothetical protein
VVVVDVAGGAGVVGGAVDVASAVEEVGTAVVEVVAATALVVLCESVPPQAASSSKTEVINRIRTIAMQLPFASSKIQEYRP